MLSMLAFPSLVFAQDDQGGGPGGPGGGPGGPGGGPGGQGGPGGPGGQGGPGGGRGGMMPMGTVTEIGDGKLTITMMGPGRRNNNGDDNNNTQSFTLSDATKYIVVATGKAEELAVGQYVTLTTTGTKDALTVKAIAYYTAAEGDTKTGPKVAQALSMPIMMMSMTPPKQDGQNGDAKGDDQQQGQQGQGGGRGGRRGGMMRPIAATITAIEDGKITMKSGKQTGTISVSDTTTYLKATDSTIDTVAKDANVAVVTSGKQDALAADVVLVLPAMKRPEPPKDNNQAQEQ